MLLMPSSFSLAFTIYILITTLISLYLTTGRNNPNNPNNPFHPSSNQHPHDGTPELEGPGAIELRSPMPNAKPNWSSSSGAKGAYARVPSGDVEGDGQGSGQHVIGEEEED
jgi:hypothetical protein